MALLKLFKHAQDFKACTAEKLTKARKSIGDARIFGRSWPFNESVVPTVTIHPKKGCALDSARGSGVHVGVVQTLLWDAASALQVPRRNSEHALSV